LIYRKDSDSYETIKLTESLYETEKNTLGSKRIIVKHQLSQIKLQQ